MKITNEHLDAMRSKVAAYLKNKDVAALVAIYEKGDFPRSEKVKDLQMRFCWDIAHAAIESAYICGLYGYLNDSHISTALKAICPKVTRNY